MENQEIKNNVEYIISEEERNVVINYLANSNLPYKDCNYILQILVKLRKVEKEVKDIK